MFSILRSAFCRVLISKLATFDLLGRFMGLVEGSSSGLEALLNESDEVSVECQP
jgi:hypothetical protein